MVVKKRTKRTNKRTNKRKKLTNKRKKLTNKRNKSKNKVKFRKNRKYNQKGGSERIVHPSSLREIEVEVFLTTYGPGSGEISSNLIFTSTMNPDSSVNDIKKEIFDRHILNINQYTLKYQGTEVDDNKTMRDLELESLLNIKKKDDVLIIDHINSEYNGKYGKFQGKLDERNITGEIFYLVEMGGRERPFSLPVRLKDLVLCDRYGQTKALSFILTRRATPQPLSRSLSSSGSSISGSSSISGTSAEESGTGTEESDTSTEETSSSISGSSI